MLAGSSALPALPWSSELSGDECGIAGVLIVCSMGQLPYLFNDSGAQTTPTEFLLTGLNHTQGSKPEDDSAPPAELFLQVLALGLPMGWPVFSLILRSLGILAPVIGPEGELDAAHVAQALLQHGLQRSARGLG